MLIHQHGADDRQTADGDQANGALVCVGHDATDVVGVMQLRGAILPAVARVEGIELGPEAYGCVVEQAAELGRGFDEPGNDQKTAGQRGVRGRK